MSAIIRALKTELSKVDKKLSRLVGIMDADPLGRIIELRQEAQGILEKHKGQHAKIAMLIDPLAKEEKKMFALSKKQMKTSLVDERVRLQSEKGQLINEIYYAERRAI